MKIGVLYCVSVTLIITPFILSTWGTIHPPVLLSRAHVVFCTYMIVHTSKNQEQAKIPQSSFSNRHRLTIDRWCYTLQAIYGHRVVYLRNCHLYSCLSLYNPNNIKFYL